MTTANTGNTAVVFNEEQRIREANERARLAMEKFYPNGTPQQVIEVLNFSNINFATNDTPEGRFENRRIEYKVATSNTTTQQVAPNSNGGGR
jgi:hypothetical protein